MTSEKCGVSRVRRASENYQKVRASYPYGTTRLRRFQGLESTLCAKRGPGRIYVVQVINESPPCRPGNRALINANT